MDRSYLSEGGNRIAVPSAPSFLMMMMMMMKDELTLAWR